MSAPRQIFWTEQQYQQSKALRDNGVSCAEIDRRFGRKSGETKHMLNRRYGPKHGIGGAWRREGQHAGA